MLANPDRESTVQFPLLKANAAIVLVWEKLWPLLVPLFIVTCSFAIFSWIGGWRFPFIGESIVLLWALKAVFAFAFLLALYPLRYFELPAGSEISRHIENKSKLADRPLTAQDDQLVAGQATEFSEVLWQEHQARMRSRLEDMTAGSPQASGSRFDPAYS